MPKKSGIGNFDLSRLTLVGWLLVLVSLAAGAATGVWVDQLLGQPPAQGQPARPNRTSPVAFAALGAGVACFIITKLLLEAAGVTVIRPPLGSEVDPQAGNAAIITELRRRHRRTRSRHRFFVWLMPLGCILPCSMAFILRDQSFSVLLGLAGMVLPIIGLAGTILMWSDRHRYRRSLALAEQADALGLTYLENPPPASYHFLIDLELFKSADDQLGQRLMTGLYGGHHVTALEYSSIHGRGRYAQVTVRSVVFLTEAVSGVPNFVLSPKTGWFKLPGKATPGAADLPAEQAQQAAFHQAFNLVAENPAQAARLFSPRLIDLCLSAKDISVEVNDGLLVVCNRTVLARAEMYTEFIVLAAEMANLLRAGAAQSA